MRNWYPPEKFGFIQGITHSASRLGAALAPPLVAFLVVASGWRSSFVLCGIAVLAWSIAWWFYFSDDPRTADLPPRSSAMDVAVPVVKSTTRTPVWALTKRMLPVTLVMFAYGWVYWIFVSWLPLYFINHHHVDLRASAFLTSVPLMAGMIGNTAGGMLSDWLLRRTKNHRIARCSVVAGSLTGCAAALVPVALAHDLGLALPCLALAMFLLELTIAPMYAIPMDMSREFAGLGSAFIIMGVALAEIASPVIFGWIIDATGNWNMPFATAVVVLLLGAGGVLLIRPDKPFVPPT